MMDKVRPPHIVSEQIRDLNKIIASAKTMLERYPDDYALQLTVAQDEQMKGRLMAELEESLSAYRQHYFETPQTILKIFSSFTGGNTK